MARKLFYEDVDITKLVHGGQGLGSLPDGRKVFVWNALPEERVRVRLTKLRRDYAEGVAEDIMRASPERIEPKDEAYLSTSPWQILSFDEENRHKQQILLESFRRENVLLSDDLPMVTDGRQWAYRNKMEYSFWGDDNGLHLALYHRGSHGKRIVNGSSISKRVINETALKVRDTLGATGIRAQQLKTVVVRCNQQNEVAVALYVKDEDFPVISSLEHIAKGVSVCYSTPKSPASVITKELYRYGDVTLTDTVLSVPLCYDVFSFFQVNVSVFEQAAEQIALHTKNIQPIVDMYAGVGTIGLPVGANVLVELDDHNIKMATRNAVGKNLNVIKASSEQVLEYVTENGAVIFDPPRAGLHAKLIERIRTAKPPKIVYLSCNPSTQARDIALIDDLYEIEYAAGYNFFPRTPHIESLLSLKIR